MSEAQASHTIQELLDLYAIHGSGIKVAEILGLHQASVNKRLKLHRENEAKRASMDPEIVRRLEAKGYTDFKGIHSGWLADKDENGVGDNIYFYAGKDKQSEDDFFERVKEAFEDMPRVKPIPAPKQTLKDLVSVYALADAHFGLLSWGVETGEDWDMKLAQKRMTAWMSHLVDKAPASDTAVLLDVGDLTHADNQENVTPGHGFQLDVDVRHFKTEDTVIMILETAIQLTLAKHKKVIVKIMKGNHNPESYKTILFALYYRYKDEPRVEVLKEPGDFWIFEWGKVMLAAHHGDKAKPEKLIGFITDTWAEIFGRTKYRFLYTGHKHGEMSKDIHGWLWEQLRAFTAKDFWSFSMAFCSRAEMSVITFSKKTGRTDRSYVGV